MDRSKTDNTSSTPLPSFFNPPINEVVCGMRFQTPEKLRIPHIGLFWGKINTDYPVIQHAPPIASVKGEIPIDQESGLPLQRVWFINKSDDQLIQFQFDRFYFNWRRRKKEYPRYHYVIEQFENILRKMQSFFKELELGDINPIEYELSYINHIVKGEGWETIDDFSNIFSDFVWTQRKGRFLPNPDNINWKVEFLLEEKMGRLSISLKQAIRTEDKVPLLVFELNAHGINELADINTFRNWYDIAHKWIVNGFTDLTTSNAHRIWKRKQ